MIDLQVNGFAGVDFNSDTLDTTELEKACRALRDDGVEGILATVITANHDAMCRRLQRIVRSREVSEEIASMIVGLHIEGPFLSPLVGYIGAHPTEHSCQANLDLAKRLLDAAGGLTRYFTLAPEQDETGELTRWLADQGIVVAAGHCNPSIDQLRRSIDNGLSAFTHLGNGCPLEMHRHDNIVQRALSFAGDITLCFIADGTHVPLFALKNYLKCAGLENCVVVSDTISAAGLGPGTYRLADQEVTIGEDLVTWSEDRTHLVGSACPLSHMVENLKSIDLSSEEIDQLVNRNPRKLIHL